MPSGLLTITDNAIERFDIFIPSLGDPELVGEALAILDKESATPDWNPGVLAASFLGLVVTDHGIRLCGCKIPDADFHYRLTPGNHVNVIRVIHSGMPQELFNGNFADFLTWADHFTERSDLMMKIVQFKYNGGTRPGAIRTVRVQNVDSQHIEGYDLEKEDLVNDGFRKYAKDKIISEIYVLGSYEEQEPADAGPPEQRGVDKILKSLMEDLRYVARKSA